MESPYDSKTPPPRGIFLQGSTLACCWDTWTLLFIKAISSTVTLQNLARHTTARECIKKTLETLRLPWERHPGSQERGKTTRPHSTTNLTQGIYWERYKRVAAHPQPLHWERSIKELNRNQGFHGISWQGVEGRGGEKGLPIFPGWPEIGGILWPDLWVILGTSGALSSNLGLFLCRTELSHLYLKPRWAHIHNGMLFNRLTYTMKRFLTTKRNKVILFVEKCMSRKTIILSNFKPVIQRLHVFSHLCLLDFTLSHKKHSKWEWKRNCLGK